MKKLKAIVYAGSILLSTPIIVAHAAGANAGGYFGAGAGASHVNVEQSALSARLNAQGYTHTGFTTDDRGTGWKVLGGYKVNPYFALEAAYLDLGKFTGSTTVTAVGGIAVPPTALNVTVKSREGLYISALGILPVTEEFSLFGRVGGYTIKSKWDVVAATGASQSDSGRNEDVAFGAGLHYDVTPNVGVRVEWERFRDVGDKNKFIEQDVDLVSLGVVYRF